MIMWNDYQILFQSLNGWSLRWCDLNILLLDIPTACPRYLYISHLQVQVARIPGAGNSRWQVARGIGNKARRASELLVQSMTSLGIWATQGGEPDSSYYYYGYLGKDAARWRCSACRTWWAELWPKATEHNNFSQYFMRLKLTMTGWGQV